MEQCPGGATPWSAGLLGKEGSALPKCAYFRLLAGPSDQWLRLLVEGGSCLYHCVFPPPPGEMCLRADTDTSH